MKKLFILFCLLAGFNSFAQTANAIPPELFTNDSTYWSITAASGVNYVNTTSGLYYNTYKKRGRNNCTV